MSPTATLERPKASKKKSSPEGAGLDETEEEGKKSGRDQAKIDRFNTRFAQSVRSEAQGVFTEGEMDFAIASFEEMRTTKERKKAYAALTSGIEAARKHKSELTQLLEGLSPRECAQAEARELLTGLDEMNWEERKAYKKEFKKNREKGLAQTEKFDSVLKRSTANKLISAEEAKWYQDTYLGVSYKDRKGLIAQLESLERKRKASVGRMQEKVKGLEKRRDIFTKDEIEKYRKRFESANPEARRQMYLEHDAEEQRLVARREASAKKYAAKVELQVQQEGSISRTEGQSLIAQFMKGTAEERRELLGKYEKHRDAGRKNKSAFDRNLALARARGELSATEEVAERQKFDNADWNTRESLVVGANAEVNGVEGSEDEEKGRYFSGRFEKMIRDIAQEQGSTIDQYRGKKESIEAGADVELASVTLEGTQAVARGDQSEHIEQDAPQNSAATNGARPEELEKLEQTGAQVILFKGMQSKARRKGLVSSLTSKALKTVFGAFLDSDSKSPEAIIEELHKKRARNEFTDEDVKRFEEAA